MNTHFDFVDKTSAEISESLTLDEKISRAMDLLIHHEPEDGYYLAFSGGKDSCVIKELAIRSGVKFDAWYNNTTIDPPELVRFIKREHKDVQWSNPEKAMMSRVAEKGNGPPTRLARWCCEEYKEQGGIHRIKIIGVRASESVRRKAKWKEVIDNLKSSKGVIVCPIVYWTEKNVWDYIRDNGLPYCELYDEGFKRLGCIGCPLGGAKQQNDEFKRWPRYGANWKKAVMKNWENNHDLPRLDGKSRYQAGFKNAEEFYKWWVSGKRRSFDEECQMELMWTN